MIARTFATLATLATIGAHVAPLLAQEQPASLLARLPANTTSLLVVRDVLPAVDRVLASPAFRDVLGSSGDLQQELFGMRLDAVAIGRQLGLVRNFIPEEIVVAASPASCEALLHLADVVIAAGVVPLLARDDNANKEVIDDVRGAAAAALRHLRTPDLVAWIRLRDERTAEGWFDNVVDALDDLPKDGTESVVVDGSITVRMRPFQVMGGRFRQLAGAGAEVPPEVDPEFVARLEQRGATLELRLGEPPAGSLDAKQLGPLWAENDTHLLFAKNDLADAIEPTAAFADRLDAIAAALDDVSMATRCSTLAGNLTELLVPTTARIVVDDGFVMTKEVELGDEADEVDVPAEAIVRCIGSGDTPFVLTVMELDSALLSVMYQVSQRLGRQGQPLPGGLDPLVEFLSDEESAVFAAGALFVTRAAQFRGATKWGIAAMPFGAAAVVAKAESDAAAKQFVATVSQHLIDGFALGGALWAEQDLGLGVATYGIDVERITPGFGEVGIDADFRPHWFVVDSVLVVSSEPALSRELIARIRGKAAPELPAKALVDWSRWRGDHLAAVVAGCAQWQRSLPEGVRPGPADNKAAPLFDALATLLRTTEVVETITALDGTVMREVTTLRLRAAPR